MDTRFRIPVIVAATLAILSVEAFAGNSWSYDEVSDTIVFAYSGNHAASPASREKGEAVQHNGNWYYEESSETIVYKGAGSRAWYVSSNPSKEAPLFDAEFAFLDQ